MFKQIPIMTPIHESVSEFSRQAGIPDLPLEDYNLEELEPDVRVVIEGYINLFSAIEKVADRANGYDQSDS